MGINSYNKHSLGHAKEKRIRYEEAKNPLQKIIRLMNQYWSIDLMTATKAEKDWAKERLEKEIYYLLTKCSRDVAGQIKISLKNKEMWEKVRDSLG